VLLLNILNILHNLIKTQGERKEEIPKFGVRKTYLCIRQTIGPGASKMGLSSMQPHSSTAGDVGSDGDIEQGWIGGTVGRSGEVKPLQMAYLVG